MTCDEVKEKKYQQRPSPPFHAKNCRGQTKKGKNGTLYVSKADSKGIYKWVPTNQTRKLKGKTYAIHDNGSRPFFVTVNGKKLSVEKSMNTFIQKNGKFVDIVKEPKHLFTRTVDEVFIGKKSPTGGYDGLKPSQAEGNSILAKDGSKYLYIGSEIYEFSPLKGDTIEKYYSDVGHSDVPYPYAVGKTHTYFLIEKKVLPNEALDFKRDLYGQFYGHIGQKVPLKKLELKLKTKLIHKRL